MDARFDLSIIVPAYNEAERIIETLRSVVRFLRGGTRSFEIIVVADGTDGTRERALAFARESNAPIQVVGSDARRGKGRAVREGVELSDGKIIGFVDADNKTPIEDIDHLLPWLAQGYDIAIGSRGVVGSNVLVRQPLHRQIGSQVFGLAMHLTTGLWGIHDTQCGFKFFSGPVARDLFSRQRIDGYMFDVEVLFLATRHGYRIKEVGVTWRDDADSRLDLIAGNWRNMIDILRIRFEPDPPPRLPSSPARAADDASTIELARARVH